MRNVATVLLVVFISFLSTPAIIKLIDKKCDTSMFYSVSEEEHSHKEVKVFVYQNISPNFSFISLKTNVSSLILSENLSKHDKISATIFVPPPNLV